MEEDGISKSNTPKERWQLLRMFIKNRNLNVQHKRSHAFGLFTSCKITDLREEGFENFDDRCEAKDDYEWLEYTCEHFTSCRLAVRQRVRAVNWNDATGFDNTGNICVWPSEEILSYLCIKKSKDFSEKTVCELGAGMTGLAGMMVAIASDVQEVLITDGNMDGVTNLQEINKANKRRFGKSEVHIRQLRWDIKEDYKDFENYFDYVICADCLLYEQVHENLLDVMSALLKADGMVLIVSPRRGFSVEHFIENAQKWFACEYIENYDEFISSEYCKVIVMANFYKSQL
ncbi:calmodulin-lysine N-methyltransferase [Paramuricea clavata]|uniref:Calmodulin-lysine N-methyltransferase n=1 Tax=Paramuricea clavata TaxID=317549 RepID=A0A6S7GSA3_PARCT|nr:calmodulin-lysine N-methyltransferase [Paramuricea clavata]